MELNQLIEALPVAASNPYAFTSYIFLIIAWVIVVFRVKRNKHLLDNLQKLPEKNRLKALKLEIHGVELKEGITPEQWIKSKIHSYLFMGFLSICLVATVLTVIYFLEIKNNTNPGEVSENLGEYTARKKVINIPGERSVVLTIDGKFGAYHNNAELVLDYNNDVEHLYSISVGGETIIDKEWVDRLYVYGVCFSKVNQSLELLYEIVSGGNSIFSDSFSFKYIKSENKFINEGISSDLSNELSNFVLCPPDASYKTKLSEVSTHSELENWKVNEVACICDYTKGTHEAENLSVEFYEFLDVRLINKSPISDGVLKEYIRNISLQSDVVPFEVNDFEFKSISVMKIEYLHHHGWNFILAKKNGSDHWVPIYSGTNSSRNNDISEVCNANNNELKLLHCFEDQCGEWWPTTSIVTYNLSDWTIKSAIGGNDCPF